MRIVSGRGLGYITLDQTLDKDTKRDVCTIYQLEGCVEVPTRGAIMTIGPWHRCAAKTRNVRQWSGANIGTMDNGQREKAGRLSLIVAFRPFMLQMALFVCLSIYLLVF